MIPSYKAFTDISDAIAEIGRIGENRYEFPFDIDGAVIKVDDFTEREQLGATAKFPRWAVAFKYPPEEKRTTLREIEIRVGAHRRAHAHGGLRADHAGGHDGEPRGAPQPGLH